MSLVTKVMKAVGAALVVFGLSSTANATLLPDVADSTYKIWVNDRANCSGVAIAPDILATAAHCVPKDTKVRMSVVKEDGFGRLREGLIVYDMDRLRVNHKTDVALLKIKGDKTFPTHVEIIDEFHPYLGVGMYHVGYPRLEELTYTEGVFTSYSYLEGFGLDSEFYKATTPVTGGSSGGGVYRRLFNVQSMEWEYYLVGLTTATYRDVSFQSYFSTLENLQKLATEYLDERGIEYKKEADLFRD